MDCPLRIKSDVNFHGLDVRRWSWSGTALIFWSDPWRPIWHFCCLPAAALSKLKFSQNGSNCLGRNMNTIWDMCKICLLIINCLSSVTYPDRWQRSISLKQLQGWQWFLMCFCCFTKPKCMNMTTDWLVIAKKYLDQTKLHLPRLKPELQYHFWNICDIFHWQCL